MSQTYLKYAASAALFVLWAALIATHNADPDLIQAIKWALAALGAFHAITNLQGAQQVVTPALLAQMIQQAVQQPSGTGKPSLPTIPLKEGS